MLKRPKKILPRRKPKAQKPRPLEDIIWERLKVPALGMLGFTVLIILIMAVDYYNHAENTRNFGNAIDLFHEWQALVGGGYAILAAIFAGRVLVLQIARAEEMEQNRLEAARLLDERNTQRDLLAARSVMPLALSVLYEYVTDLALAADQVLKTTRSRRIRKAAPAMPPLPAMPASVIADLQSFIRAADVQDGRAVADVLSDLQLLSANAHGIWAHTTKGGGTIVMRDNYEALIGRAAVQHARVSGLFPYARREVDHPLPPTEKSVREALNLWFVVPDPKYLAAALLYLKRVTSPSS